MFDEADVTQQVEATPSPCEPKTSSKCSLEDLVLARLREYASNLQGHAARNMYDLIMPQLERPLVRVALELAEGRQTHAAEMLGIHRNTLRTRIRALGLESSVSPNKDDGELDGSR